jgi:hypothetical protein
MMTSDYRKAIRIARALLVSMALALALLGALYLTLWPPAVAASGPAPIEPWGTGSEHTTSLAVGDMDNDGDLDLVIGNEGEPNRVYRNDGHGRFPQTDAITLTNPVSGTRAIAVADLNGDAWLDIVALSPGYPAQLYLNAGQVTLTFTLTQMLTDTQPVTPVLAIGDLDGDADFDLVIGGEDSATRVYLNDGHGAFSAAAWLTTTQALGATAMALADVNVDGRLDLVLGFDHRPVQTFLNENGAGFAPSGEIGTARGRVAALVAGDLNGDGRPDVGIAYSDLSSQTQAIAIYTHTLASWSKTSDISFTDNDMPMTLALGDVNNDDTLDLAVGFGLRSGSAATRNRVLFNDGRAGFNGNDLSLFGSGGDRTFAVALADLNDDGRLDFIAANYGERHRIYFTPPSGPQLIFADSQGGPSRQFISLALGDLDGNGTLDAVAGVNEGKLTCLRGSSASCGISAKTYSLALADLNKDGALDIISGNGAPTANTLYYNDGQGGFATTLSLGGAMSNTFAVAIGDLNRDTWPDIVAGSKKQSAIYLNDGKGSFSTVATQGLGQPTDPTSSVAIGDLNRDGWPDIAVGNENAANAVYFNDGTGRFTAEPNYRFGTEFESTKALVLGDLDGDGDLDLVVANFYAPNVVYFNDGQGRFTTESAAYLGTLDNKTYSVGLADFDGDGSLDIVAGTWATAEDVRLLALDNVVYLNDGRGGFSDARTIVLTRGKHFTRAVAVGDLNADGKPDVVLADRFNPNDGTGRLMFYLNRRRGDARADTQTIRLTTDGPIKDEQGLTAAHALTYSLAVPNGGCDFTMAPAVSLDDGNTWFTPAFRDLKVLQSRSATSVMATRMMTWSVPDADSRWHDDMDLRLVLTSTVTPCRNRTAGPYQYRMIRHGQARIPILTPLQVISGTQPISGALVYRQATHERLAAPLTAADGATAQTDACGRLDACGQTPDLVDLNRDDRLFALWPMTTPLSWPITLTWSVSPAQRLAEQPPPWPLTRTQLYFTSAPIIAVPNLNRNPLQTQRVAADLGNVSVPGTQTLTITSSNPLVIFDLSVALEWDASRDRQYVARLTSDLQRTSELLYDWTNGQAALGKITLYHDAARQPTANGSNRWLDADIRIHATNRLRPSATQGGVVSAIITDPLQSKIAYGPGVVDIGATWNRFGDSTAGNLGEDWSRALAHELGHYLFFLDDNYLGLDEAGLLTPVTDCSGAMADPYKEDDSRGNGEFHLADEAWRQADCQQTLSNRDSGRADWATIETFYPALRAPYTNTLGPDTLPLSVTQLSEVTPIALTATLAVPIFYLLDAQGHSLEPGPGVRAFLYKADNRIIDLGRPRLNQVQAWGAQPGDTLCVMDADAGRQGCTAILERGNQELVLAQLADSWRPDVRVSPVSSTTVAVTLTGVPSGLNFSARVVPTDAPLTTTLALTGLAPINSSYAVTLPFYGTAGFIDIVTDDASRPCLAKYLDQSSAPICRITLDLAMGGSPAFVKGTGRLAFIKGTGRLAPILSTDGQAMLFSSDLNLDGKHLAILQTAVTLPELPPWTTRVGHAYRLETTPNITLTKTSLSIGYLGTEVPPGEEAFLRIYHWDDTWRPLTTTIATDSNNAVAVITEPGYYALLSSTEIPLDGAGWHLFGYPVADPPTRTVTQAFASLPVGSFTAVYGYSPTNTTDPWSVYLPEPAAGAAFNDLTELHFGQGYFIYTTDTILLRLKGLSPFMTTVSNTLTNAPPVELAASRWPTLSLVSPPALIYGLLMPGPGFTPAAGLTVTAWINGRPCGDGSTMVMTDGIGYGVKVRAADQARWQGCGTPGALVTFTLSAPAVTLRAPTPVTWSNDAAKAVNFGFTPPSAQCQELLRNGDFEHTGNWQMVTTDSTARYSTTAPHAGARALRLGLLPTDPDRRAGLTLSSAYQDVRLPTSADLLMLTLWIEPGTQATSGDYQRLLLFDLNRDGSPRELWRRLENQSGWSQLSFDLTAYRGRTVRVYLEVKNDSQRLPGRTWLYVDDVSLCAGQRPPP